MVETKHSRGFITWVALIGLVVSAACSQGGGGPKDTVLTAENVVSVSQQLKQQLTVEEGELLRDYVSRVHPELPQGQLPVGQSAAGMIAAQRAFLAQGGPGSGGESAAASEPGTSPVPTQEPSAPAAIADSGRQAPPATQRPAPVVDRPAEPREEQSASVAPSGEAAPVAVDQPSSPVQEVAPLETVQRVTALSGQPIRIRLLQDLSSKTAQVGQQFRAQLEGDLMVDGQLVATDGSSVLGKITENQASGKVKGKASMAITITRLTVEGDSHELAANTLRFEATSTTSKDAKRVGIGAGAGAIIGAIAGGKKGALIGGAIGAGAGTGVALATTGEEVEFKTEQLFEFRLEQDLELPVIRVQ